MSNAENVNAQVRKDLASPFFSEERLVDGYSKLQGFIREGAEASKEITTVREDVVERIIKGVLSRCSDENVNYSEMTSILCNLMLASMYSTGSALGVQCVATACESVKSMSVSAMALHIIQGTFMPKHD